MGPVERKCALHCISVPSLHSRFNIKRLEDNIREWTGLKLGRCQRAVENREKWRKLVAKSFLVPQRPSQLRDRWWWWFNINVWTGRWAKRTIQSSWRTPTATVAPEDDPATMQQWSAVSVSPPSFPYPAQQPSGNAVYVNVVDDHIGRIIEVLTAVDALIIWAQNIDLLTVDVFKTVFKSTRPTYLPIYLPTYLPTYLTNCRRFQNCFQKYKTHRIHIDSSFFFFFCEHVLSVHAMSSTLCAV